MALQFPDKGYIIRFSSQEPKVFGSGEHMK